MDYKCIWVKYGGWPLWPCRLANGCEVGPKLASGKESEDQVLVKFFGTPDEYAWVESKNIKNFSLKSINELNPLFRSVSERKLYETAIKEVIEWHKTKDEDRIIPVWKPGDEDTQGTHSLSNSEDSDDDGGGNNDWDYIDVGSSSIIDDDVAESTLESYDTPPKETSKSSKKQKSPPRTEHIKREKSSGGEQKRGVQYKALQINRQYEKSTNSKQNDTTDNTLASGKDPPNKILASTDKKRQLDLVGAGFSNSPKKHKPNFTNDSNQTNNIHATNDKVHKTYDKNKQNNPNETNTHKNNENKYESKIFSNKDSPFKKQHYDKAQKHIETKFGDSSPLPHSPHTSSPLLHHSSPSPPPSPSSPFNNESLQKSKKTKEESDISPSPPSSPHFGQKHTKTKDSHTSPPPSPPFGKPPKKHTTKEKINISHSPPPSPPPFGKPPKKHTQKTTKENIMQINNSDTEDNINYYEPRKKIIQNKAYFSKKGNTENPKTNNIAYEAYVPDTPTQVAIEDTVIGEISKEREKTRKYVEEQISQVRKSFDASLYEVVNKIVEEKLQGQADKLWDQQTAFEDKIKTYLKNEMAGFRKEIINLQTELDKSLHSLAQNRKGTTQTVITLLKDTIVKLEQYGQ